MKKILMMLVAAAAVAAGAKNYVWVGGEGDSMNSNKWEDEDGNRAKPGANDILIFRGDANCVCANDYGQLPIAGLRVESGDVTITSLYNGSRLIQFTAPTNEVYIAPGASLNLDHGPSIGGTTEREQVVILNNLGSFTFSGNSSMGRAGDSKEDNNKTILKAFIVQHDLDIPSNAGGDSIWVFDIADGVKVRMLNHNKFQNSAIVKMGKGSTLDFCGNIDTLGAIVGEGHVIYTASNFCTYTLPERFGPYYFGGTTEGLKIKVDQSVITSNGGGGQQIILTSPQAFADVTFAPSAAVGASQLLFAPGHSDYYVKDYRNTAEQPLCVENTDGKPITVHGRVAENTTAIPTVVTGAGSFAHTYTDGPKYSGAAFANEGGIGVENTNMTLGDGTVAGEFNWAAHPFYWATYPGILRLNNGAPATIDMLLGDGCVEAVGAAEMTINGLQLKGNASWFKVIKGQRSVVLNEPDTNMDELNIEEGGQVVINGGRMFGKNDSLKLTTNGSFMRLNGNMNASTLIVTNGAEIATHTHNTTELVVEDSTWRLYGGADNVAAESSVTLNGAHLIFGAGTGDSFNSYLGIKGSTQNKHLYIGEKGATMEMLSISHLYGAAINKPEPVTPGADGGLTFTGGGWMRLNSTLGLLSGPINFERAYINISEYEPIETVGDTTFESTYMYGNASSASANFATGTDKTITVKGSSTFLVLDSGKALAINFASPFVFEPLSAMFLRTRDVIPSTTFAELPADAPIFGFSYTGGTTSDEFTNGRGTFRFLKMDGNMLVEDTDCETFTAATPITENTTLGNKVRAAGATFNIASGVTLTIGNNNKPAALLLMNSHLAPNNTEATLSGAGTIDFGTSPAIIAINELRSGSVQGKINCSMAGTGGVLFTAPGGTMSLELGANNSFSGTTVIDGVCLMVDTAGGLGSSEVVIPDRRIYGGELQIMKAITLPNNITMGGWGNHQSGNIIDHGALMFSENATCSGTITLTGNTRIAAAVAKRGNLTGTITGNEQLEIWGSGTICLSGVNNDLTSDILVNAGATLAVTHAAALGTGRVEVLGTLRIENANECTIANTITGNGTIVIAGQDLVSFADLENFTGRIVYESGSTDIAGEDTSASPLEGAADIGNTGDAATLTTTGEAVGIYTGTISGDINFVKDGTGVEVLRGANTYTGATIINAGTLALGAVPNLATTLPVTDAALRLDANANVSDDMTTWADADGRDFSFVSDSELTGTLVTRDNGPAVNFNGTDFVRMVAANSVTFKTFLSVCSSSGAGGLHEMFGTYGKDSGLRVNGKTWGDTQEDYINGTSGGTFTANTPFLFTRIYPAAQSYQPAVGAYSTLKRIWQGDVHEIVAYNRDLSMSEMQAVQDYMMVKWGLKTPAEPVANVLPTTTAVTIAEDATLDLNGCDQALESIDVTGALINSAARNATLTLSGESTLALGATFGGEWMSLNLQPGATLDLGGGEFTVRYFSGSLANVTNGTLHILRSRGTLITIR